MLNLLQSIIPYFVKKVKGYYMKLVDLFAGCGGMSLGFSKAGFDIVGAYEFWDVAVKCYQTILIIQFSNKTSQM